MMMSVSEPPPEIEFIKFLGKGSFGSVSLYKYSNPRIALYTAVKTSNPKRSSSLFKEFKILSQFKDCPRIVQCYEDKVIEHLNSDGVKEYMMHMEYAAGGSLRTFTNTFKDKILPDRLIRDFTRMLLKGLATIHGHGYVHCDLKPENILVFPKCVYKNGACTPSYELKISDFGLTKRDGDSEWWTESYTCVGTPIYMSPESVSHGETGRGLDLWSLGCVVLQMYTGKRPWSHKIFDLEDLKNCYEPLIPNDLPYDAQNFIMTCFALYPDQRKDALKLLEHCFVRENIEIATKSLHFLSIAESIGEVKIIKEPPRPNFGPVHRCDLALVF